MKKFTQDKHFEIEEFLKVARYDRSTGKFLWLETFGRGLAGLNKKRIILGYFVEPSEAYAAYRAGKAKYHLFSPNGRDFPPVSGAGGDLR